MQKIYIYLSCFIILIIGLLSYFNSFYNGFVWDDEVLIEQNGLIRDSGHYKKILTQELMSGSKTNYYRPVQVFSYMLDYHIWKLNPFGYHLTNFLIHILNAILVYLLIINLMLQASSFKLHDPRCSVGAPSLQPTACSLQHNFIPLITALFWVVHPVHVEAVSYISGRADLLAAFFMLSAMLLYIRSFSRPKLAACSLQLAALLFTLSLFSKEVSLVFPLILVCYEGLFRKSDRFKSKLMRILPFLFIGIIYIVLRLTILQFGACLWAKASFYADKNIMRLFTFLKCLVIYLGLLIIPINMHMERFMIPATKLFDPYVLAAISIIVIFIVIFKQLRIGTKRFVAFGILWFLVFLFPQSTFLFTILLAEHFLYLPSIGIFFIFAYGLAAFYSSHKVFVRGISIVIVSFWGLFTFAQNYVWRDNLTFYRWTDKFSPTSFKTRNNLANMYFLFGREDLAIAKYEQALEVSPKTSAIRENMGYAEDYFIKKYKDQLKLGLNFARHHYNLAYLYQRKGRFDEAILHYKKAIEINPKFAEAIGNLGNIYEAKWDFDGALVQYRQAITADPNFATGYFNIGVVLAEQGKLREAREYFAKALKIEPDYHKAVEYMSQIEDMLK